MDIVVKVNKVHHDESPSKCFIEAVRMSDGDQIGQPFKVFPDTKGPKSVAEHALVQLTDHESNRSVKPGALLTLYNVERHEFGITATSAGTLSKSKSKVVLTGPTTFQTVDFYDGDKAKSKFSAIVADEQVHTAKNHKSIRAAFIAAYENGYEGTWRGVAVRLTNKKNNSTQIQMLRGRPNLSGSNAFKIYAEKNENFSSLLKIASETSYSDSHLIELFGITYCPINTFNGKRTPLDISSQAKKWLKSGIRDRLWRNAAHAIDLSHHIPTTDKYLGLGSHEILPFALVEKHKSLHQNALLAPTPGYDDIPYANVQQNNDSPAVTELETLEEDNYIEAQQAIHSAVDTGSSQEDLLPPEYFGYFDTPVNESQQIQGDVVEKASVEKPKDTASLKEEVGVTNKVIDSPSAEKVDSPDIFGFPGSDKKEPASKETKVPAQSQSTESLSELSGTLADLISKPETQSKPRSKPKTKSSFNL